MGRVIWLYLSASVLLGTAVFALAGLRRTMLAASAFAVFVAGGLIAFGDALGNPKPFRLEWLRPGVEYGEILAFLPVPGSAIYLWLAIPGETAPVYYVVPWSAALARALEEGRRSGRPHALGGLFQGSWEEDAPPRVYPLPQPKLPEKMGEPPPMEYNAPREM